jgi:hypothetical protein
MKRSLVVTVLALTAALGACNDNEVVAGPAANRTNWGWDKPLATGGSDPVLICSPTTVSHLGSVTCTFAGGGPLNLPVWHFEAEGGFYVQGPGLTSQWAGNMVVGGDVVADWVDLDTGQPGTPLRQTIIVQRRNWSWVSSVGGQTGTPGEIDACFGTSWNLVGLTARKDCPDGTAGVFFSPWR